MADSQVVGMDELLACCPKAERSKTHKHDIITKKHLCDRVTQVTDTRSKLPKHTQV